MGPMWFQSPDIPLLLILAFKYCQLTCCASREYVCDCLSVLPNQSHLVPQTSSPPALPFSPNYFHPSSKAVSFGTLGAFLVAAFPSSQL